eukprot:g36909.t1
MRRLNFKSARVDELRIDGIRGVSSPSEGDMAGRNLSGAAAHKAGFLSLLKCRLALNQLYSSTNKYSSVELVRSELEYFKACYRCAPSRLFPLALQLPCLSNIGPYDQYWTRTVILRPGNNSNILLLIVDEITPK